MISSASIDIDEGGDVDGDNIVNGTDPDDDGDGLSDADEIGSYGTDPFSNDTDGDTFDDRVEVSLGSDPLNADSTPIAHLPALAPRTQMLLLGLLLALLGLRQRVR